MQRGDSTRCRGFSLKRRRWWSNEWSSEAWALTSCCFSGRIRPVLLLWRWPLLPVTGSGYLAPKPGYTTATQEMPTRFHLQNF